MNESLYPKTLLTPGDPGWDDARRPWNLAFDQRPDAIMNVESPDDVAAAFNHARSRGLRVTAQGTGHGAGMLRPLAGTLLVRTSRMRKVQIDPGARRARVEAGAWWQDVTVPAATHGLAALAGSSPDVGVAGYLLGGGVSWLARRYGLATNTIQAVELVTADGRLRRVDQAHDPWLFWALRGGGGSFGIVTALEFELFPIREAYAGALFWPIDRAPEVLHAWAQWTADGVPEELTSIGRVLRFPSLPELPDHLRGRDFVILEAAYVGPEATGAGLLQPFRSMAPVMDTFATVPMPALQSLHMDPEAPVPALADGSLLTQLPGAAIDSLLAVVGPGCPTPLLSVEVRHIGGAAGRTAPDHGALARLDGDYLFLAAGITPDPDTTAQVGRDVQATRQAVAPWASAYEYANFCERPGDAGRLFPPDVYRRLRMIKTEVDPDNLIEASHFVPPAG
ncbi:FAD-binding oxidoreductase [Microlunatus sp. GCM10028923]|uniref:FAD-binding oxidoreductase n=1 Tax=Microlunatus sp. GCM10028923 TaxID=3273400 RepID=UPI0036199805